jgi:hypothetical protein
VTDVLDPEMLVFDEFLWECLHHPHMHPGSKLTLSHPDQHECEMVNDRVCFSGAILWQGDVVYRVGDYEAETNSWWARWPD